MNGVVKCAFGCEPSSVHVNHVYAPTERGSLFHFQCEHGSEIRKLSDLQQLNVSSAGYPASFLRPLHELKYIQATRKPRSLLLFNRKRKDPRKLGFVP